jgi:hypothetical protein
LKFLPRSFVTDGLQGAQDRLRPEYPLNCFSLKGLIPKRVLKRPVDVVALIVLLHAEDISGMEPAVSGMPLDEPFQELRRRLSQLHKGFSHRLKTIPYPFRPEVLRVLYLPAKPGGLPCLDRQMLLSAGITHKLSKSPILFIRSTASHIHW